MSPTVEESRMDMVMSMLLDGTFLSRLRDSTRQVGRERTFDREGQL